MSEKTLASGKQLLTLTARMQMCMSPLEIDAATAQFLIDNPEAVKYRAELFAKCPTVVNVLGYRCGPARGLATLINTWWGAHGFDIYAFDDWFTTKVDAISIHPCADIVVIDTVELCHLAKEIVEKDPNYLNTKIIYVGKEPEIFAVENVAHKCETAIHALQLIGDLQIEKITTKLEARMAEFIAGPR